MRQKSKATFPLAPLFSKLIFTPKLFYVLPLWSIQQGSKQLLPEWSTLVWVSQRMQILPDLLLLCRSPMGHSSCPETAPPWALHSLHLSPGHIHLLHRGSSMGGQVCYIAAGYYNKLSSIHLLQQLKHISK